MADHDYESPDALILVHVLEKLRARDGLTLARLQTGREEAASLLRLHATQRFADVHQVSLPAAAIGVVSHCVLETIDGTQRIVADTILALGLFTDRYRQHRIEDRIIQALRSNSLGVRRTALLTNWRALQTALGLQPGEPPSDRTLRGTIEHDVLRELARQLVRREVNSVGSRNAKRPARVPAYETRSTTAAVNGAAPGSTGRVTVVGGAVMDATFRTRNLPARETSSEAYGFDLVPGGKGLSQAVAAARLGLDVRLIAAVADDRFGQEITRYLRKEGVDTSLLKVIPRARTPFTGVIELELGDSIAVNWRNQQEVRLDPGDIDALTDGLIDCEAVLVTFEVPRETVQHALEAIHPADGNRPLVIVTPGQPYQDGGLAHRSLAQIDFLVAHPWELADYSPLGRDAFDPDPVARHLLTRGVENLCLLVNGGCTVYSDTQLNTFNVPTFPSIYKETSAARDAFCAGLAAQLIDHGGKFDEQIALWATAAMSCATADFPLSNSMPDRRRVDDLLSRSRFLVKPQ